MSKLILFDFECETCNLVFDDLVQPDIHELQCKCGGVAKRQISGCRLDWRAMGLDPSFPTAYEKWDRVQRSKAKQENHNLVMY